MLRSLRADDLPAVLAIERRAYSHPWTEGMFRDCLADGNICRVAERDGVIVGYMMVSVAVGECQIYNVCSDPDHRRAGIARQLMNTVLAEACRRGAEVALLEVRAGNEAAILLYESYGFERVGRRKHYYPAEGGREDALLFNLDLTLGLPSSDGADAFR